MYSAVSASDKEQTKYIVKIETVQCIRLHFHIQLVYVCMCSLCRNLVYRCTESGKPFGMAGKLDSDVIMFVFCQKCKKATLIEYSNALVHCLTCFIDVKHISMYNKATTQCEMEL